MRLLTGKHRRQWEELQMFAQRKETALGLREEQIARLDAEITKLRADHERERQRADAAVDELLAIRGIPPISPQPPMAPSGDFNPLAEDPVEAAKIEKRMLEMGPNFVLTGITA